MEIDRGRRWSQAIDIESLDHLIETHHFILGYAPTVGDSYTLINNDSTDAVTGTFAGLAQGATFDTTFNTTTYRFQVDYAGGTNTNDVIVTNVTIPSELVVRKSA